MTGASLRDRVLSPSATEPVPVSAHSGDARSRKHSYFAPKIPKRTLSDEQARLIVQLYIVEKRPAKEAAEGLGEGNKWAQSDIYTYARKLQRRLGLAPYDNRAPPKIDWGLAEEFKNEGMTSAEMAAFFGVAHKSIEYGVINIAKPRRQFRKKDTCRDG